MSIMESLLKSMVVEGAFFISKDSEAIVKVKAITEYKGETIVIYEQRSLGDTLSLNIDDFIEAYPDPLLYKVIKLKGGKVFEGFIEELTSDEYTNLETYETLNVNKDDIEYIHVSIKEIK